MLTLLKEVIQVSTMIHMYNVLLNVNDEKLHENSHFVANMNSLSHMTAEQISESMLGDLTASAAADAAAGVAAGTVAGAV